MSSLSLLILPSEEEYKKYFVESYCEKSPILTWDGLPVFFYPDMFEHSFYKREKKTWKSLKDSVDLERCKRMHWIKDVLLDSSIIPRKGYDKARKKYDDNSRVALVSKDRYVVVIRKAGKSWRFVTAYLIDNDDSYNKILSSPIWEKE